MIRANVTCVGTELIARRSDTNGPEVARALAARGVSVVTRGQVGDDPEDLRAAVERAARSHDLVVLVGGLGPTEDDRTRGALAALLGVDLVVDEGTRERLEARAARRDTRPAAAYFDQALVPAGCGVVPNDLGSAPGLVGEGPDVVVAALPGPPSELRGLLDRVLDSALERLVERGLRPEPARPEACLRLGGLGESDAAAAIEGLPELAGVDVAWLCAPGEVELFVSHAAPERLAAAVEACRARLGAAVVSTDGRSAAAVVVHTLAERGETVTAAESITGGLIAAALTDVPGASAVFRGSFVTYSDEAKALQLGVPPEVLAEHGAVSQECVSAMAAGARRAGQSDFALATTGFAGPEGGTEDAPVGTVFLGLAHADGRVETKRLDLHGDRDTVRRRAAASALDLLRRRLVGG